MSDIGLLNEKPLHASLKEWYAQPGDRMEVPIDGFFIDIVRGDLLLEIQTGNFSSIKSKIEKLVRSHRIRLIYPIAIEKQIVRLSPEDEGEITRRKSPKRGRVEDVFWQMVSFPHLLMNPNFSLEVLMVREEEIRRYQPGQSWRRRGWVTQEHRLLEVVDRFSYHSPGDWQIFLPNDRSQFTANELAETSGVAKRLAQRMVYCLRHAGVLRVSGKRGRANVYGLSCTNFDDR